MASYPGAIATLNNPNPTDYMSDPGTLHNVQHSNANDEIEAIQTELGLNPRGSAASVAARLTTLESSVSSLVPAGAMFNYAGTSAPAGYLLCYGQTVSRTTYAALFTAIGTAYNTGGEAVTDFRLPDSRGRTMVGLDNMGGTDAGRLTSANVVGTVGGAESVVLVQGNLPAHTHTIDHGHANTFAITSHTGSSSGHSVDHAHTLPDHAHSAYTFGGNGAHSHVTEFGDQAIFASGGSTRTHLGSKLTGVAGAHEHNVGVNGSGAIATGGASIDHSHTINHGHPLTGAITSMTGASGSVGSGTAVSLMNPFITTLVIIKY